MEVMQPTPEPEATPQAPVEPTTTEEVKVETAPEAQPQDILSKINQGKLEDVKMPDAPKPDEFVFNSNDIDKIEDPQAREYAQNAHKSLERGYNEKFQELAKARKALESMQNTPQAWTAEKVQALVQDPAFVQAAQSVIGTQTSNPQGDDQWSALSDQERSMITNMSNKVSSLEQQNQNLLLQQQKEAIKAKYANYNEAKLETFVSSVNTGQYVPTLEDAHKIITFDDAVQKAYNMGLRDKTGAIPEKIDSVSTDGLTVTPNTDIPPAEEGMSTRERFKQIALHNIKKFGNMNNKQPVT